MRQLEGITDLMNTSLSKLGDGEGQGGPVCCSPQGHKESDTTATEQGATRKLLKFISEFSQVGEYTINTQKSVALLYTNSEVTEREIKETTTSKRIKMPRNTPVPMREN